MSLVNPEQDVQRLSRGARYRRMAARNPLLVIGGAVILLIILVTAFAPWIAPHDPTALNLSNRLQAPNAENWFGTDVLGRDIFSQVLYGGQLSLLVGSMAVFIAMLIGIPIGLVAGYFGGRFDAILMRVSDVFLAFPPLLLPIAITAALGAGLLNTMLAIGISWFPWYARIVRASVISVKSELYVTAARAMGVSHTKVMIRHALPNASTPVMVQGSMDFGYTILAAASLSFIGLGARPPAIEWGLMVASSRALFLDYWWTAAFPGLAIFVTVLAVNLFGDGLRDALDPKFRGRV